MKPALRMCVSFVAPVSLVSMIWLAAVPAYGQVRTDRPQVKPPPTDHGVRSGALPGGTTLQFDGGEITLTYTRAYVAPPGTGTVRVKWNTGRVRAASAVLLQVSRTAFNPDGDPSAKPVGFLFEWRLNGAAGSTALSPAMMAGAGGIALPQENARQRENPGRLRPPDGGPEAGRVNTPAEAAFFARGGLMIFHVRVVPLASIQKPTAVGLASPELQIAYGKAPPMGFKIEPWTPKPGEPAPIECLSMSYTPAKYYCFIHPNPSVCAKVGHAKPWYEQVVTTFIDVWDFAVETYNKAKKAAVDLACSALPFVPREAFEYALDTALVACGLPPNIPNLDQAMSMGADYLAGEIVAELGPPVAGDVARDKIKQAILAGAKAAAKKVGDAGPDQGCQYNFDPPVMILLVRNRTNQTLGELKIFAMDDTQMFHTYGQTISSLKPGAALPVVIPLLPNMHASKYVKGGIVQTAAWWQDYNKQPDNVNVFVNGKPFGAATGSRLFNTAFEIKK